MMTGRYPQRNGLVGLTHHGFELNQGERHAAALFRDGGYHSVLFQFQHEAVAERWASLGYQAYRCRESGSPDYPHMFRPATEVARHVAEFLSEPGERPFFAHVGFNETHTPFDFGGVTPSRQHGVTVPGHIRRDAAAERHFAHLQGAIERVDEAVGRILAALADNRLEENTLVVFYSDHGYEARRDKWTLYDPGIAIPMIFRWPGVIPAGRHCDALRGNVDLLPTLLDLGGLPLPGDLDGRSFAPLLKDPAAHTDPGAERFFGIYYNGAARCIRTRTRKLIHHLGPEPYMAKAPVPLDDSDPKYPRPDWELYDLEDDPLETNNLWNESRCRAEGRALAGELIAWMRSTNDPALARP
jgi:arylsulfatase A-like enzyme